MKQLDTGMSDRAAFRKVLTLLYGPSADLDAQHDRYAKLVEQHAARFGTAACQLFSSPGRAEILGNHTDHNGGRVLTASVSVDAVAAASPAARESIVVYSDGYEDPFTVELNDLSVREGESGTAALIRGVCAGFWQRGFKIGGFNANLSSAIALGSGLSSSAAIELLLGTILNDFFNEGAVPFIELAKIGQFAENKYWKKPSGLLDQMGCGIGGLGYIDFKDKENPDLKRIPHDFESDGYKLVIVNSGGSHADLTSEYAAIPKEMWAVAEFFGKGRLSEVTREEFLQELPALRKVTGDRAVLRAMHYFAENERVDEAAERIKSGDLPRFLALVRSSGRSSWALLQNCYEGAHPAEQPIPLAVALSEQFLADRKVDGAARVHGGGFAGTILAIVPTVCVPKYRAALGAAFGEDAITDLGVRAAGAVNLSALAAGENAARAA